MTEENIRKIVSEIQELWDRPETFVSDMDKERFKSYSDKWRKKKSISEIWRENDVMFLNLFYRGKVITKARKLLPDYFDAFQNLVCKIVTPYVLRDFLMLEMNGDDGWVIVLKILENAPITNTGDNLFEDEIKYIVAPVTLDVLVWYILYKKTERPMNSKFDKPSESLARINQLANILKRRSDGFYLTYHYLKYLLWREPKTDLFYELLDILENAFHDEANKRLVKNHEIIVEGLGNISSSEVAVFKTTGILNTSRTDLLINFRTAVRLIGFDEHAKKSFHTFESVFSYNVQSFLTNDVKFQLKHYDIAMLFLLQDDVLGAWKKIQALMRAGLHRLSNEYFYDQSSNLRYHIEFMWNVNLRMMDYFCREDSEMAKIMWNEFWEDGLEYSRRFSKFHNDAPYKYLSALICYYYICFIKKKTFSDDTCASEKFGECSKDAGNVNDVGEDMIKDLMPYFYEIDNMPVLVLMAVQLLMSNGIKRNDLMTEEGAKFFEESFCKALVWTKGKKQYEWVGQYLKKEGFVGRRCI